MSRLAQISFVIVLAACTALSTASAGAMPTPSLRMRPADRLMNQQSSRRPLVTTSPRSTAANSTAYQDSLGEDPAGPDITSIVVSNDDAATITFRINTPNRAQYSQDVAVLMDIDSDANQATGDPQSLGADFFVQLVRGELILFEWDGSGYQVSAAQSSLSYSWSNGPTIRINAADLNNTRRLAFDVLAVSGIAFDATTGAIDCTNCHRDFAPATGLYAYDVQISSPKPNPPPSSQASYLDAPKLPSRIRYTGNSIKHVRLGEKLYDTMQRLQKEGKIRVPRVIAVACWSKTDWPSVAQSADIDVNPNLLSGFYLGADQPRWIHIAPKQCGDVQALMLTRQSNGQRAYALSTVLHERVHAEGVDNEAMTNCFGVQLVYDFARELNFVPTKALRLEQLAVRISRRVAPRGYWNAANCRDGGAWDLYPEFQNLTY